MTFIPNGFSGSLLAKSRSIALAAALAASTAIVPAGTALAQDGETITAVMHSGLRVLDPIITTAHITRNHGYMIYDVLIAMDENFEVHPQMAEFEVSDDGLTYTFTLRDGLMFHDGEPVTAADAVASLNRWGERDSGGQLIFDVTESLEASDDKTITWTLSEPFAPLLDIVGKQSAVPPFIMPARVAETPSSEAITEYVGSGPFTFVEEEFEPGVSVTYAKFEDYVPREEPANWMSGGKVVNVDRVVWTTMPDAQTAMNALVSGEIDYLEQSQIDLLPILEASPDVVVEVRDPLGYQTMGRMNFKHPPFDDEKIRQAALMAMGQESVLATLIGNPEYYSLCGAIFGCGTPLASETGSETLKAGGDPEGARALLEEAGYDNTPVVLMQPTDVTTLTAQPVVAAQQLREAGFNVDMQAMDWQTLVTRRASQAAPADGGWNIFFTNWMVPEISSPLINPMVNGRGDDAWFGWPEDADLEALRDEFIAADDAETQAEVAERIQAHVIETVNYVPLGQYLTVQARRSNIVDMIQSPVPVFWQIDKSE
ncbi:ABC transporter substrate-binding protein [Mesorhizobium sp. YIM 152430]|uniref:ABC transporter substrate-binding protein n=1 Tax=Mesorhizobium sp. YIM 152430 TaxID=3031761 RepID=UPI0023DCBFBE|nr:ABC transporter substrate-binding protein [Mesorhizobium sp. YIM 152430]MDF1601519.1 ABC transporter substrate-binding protein [Mesorhizobium sp. YIM 152430]